jgi:hypothetical protein
LLDRRRAPADADPRRRRRRWGAEAVLPPPLPPPSLRLPTSTSSLMNMFSWSPENWFDRFRSGFEFLFVLRAKKEAEICFKLTKTAKKIDCKNME